MKYISEKTSKTEKMAQFWLTIQHDPIENPLSIHDLISLLNLPCSTFLIIHQTFEEKRKHNDSSRSQLHNDYSQLHNDYSQLQR